MEFSSIQDLTNLIGVDLQTAGAVSAGVYFIVEAVKRQFGLRGLGTQLVALIFSGYFALQLLNPFEFGDWWQFANLWLFAFLVPAGINGARKNDS